MNSRHSRFDPAAFARNYRGPDGQRETNPTIVAEATRLALAAAAPALTQMVTYVGLSSGRFEVVATPPQPEVVQVEQVATNPVPHRLAA